MKLNKESIGARLYRLFYSTQEMPLSLCPYFWKLVLMYILILPSFILALPLIITRENEPWWMKNLLGVIVYLAIFGVTIIENSILYQFRIIGVISSLFLLTWAIIETIDLIRKKLKKNKTYWYKEYSNGKYTFRKYSYDENDNRIYKNTNFYTIRNFISAKVNNYCPKIDWDGK